MQLLSVDLPGGVLPLNSKFYIKRYPIENLIYQQVCKEGSLIRIKAPQQMGKTSLVFRLIAHTQNVGYYTVYLDLQQADENIFNSLDKFLRWFCANVAQQLGVRTNFNEFWDKDIGSKVSCTLYLRDYLLQQISNPLVIVINELNSIFNYPNLAENFLVILRSWYEESRYNDIFKKLRLVLVHSTEAYINLNTNQSPLNIGLTVKLPEFTIEEIHELAERYQLNWNVVGKNNVLALKTMVGGHPYLVQLALYNLVKSPQTTLQELLKEAPTINGIYSAHLRRLLMVLHDYPELGIALKKVIATNSFLELDQILAYKLESMGLVKLNGNKCTVSCELYRQFFAPQTFDEFSFHNQIQILRDQNIRLNYLCNIDDLTQLYNKRYFYAYLENCWKKSAFEKTPLSLILLDIDSLKIYNLTCGREAGDECVQQIANVIPSCVSQRDALVARYQDDTFAVILPNITADVAFEIAENIREEVKKLAIKHAIAKLGGLKLPVVTVSLGVACTIPTIEKFVGVFVGAALKALDESKKCEGDCTCVSNTFKYGFF